MQNVSKVFIICCYFCLCSLVGPVWNDLWPEKAHKQNPNWGTWVVRLFPTWNIAVIRPAFHVCELNSKKPLFFSPEVSPQPFVLYIYGEAHFKSLLYSCILSLISATIKSLQLSDISLRPAMLIGLFSSHPIWGYRKFLEVAAGQ